MATAATAEPETDMSRLLAALNRIAHALEKQNKMKCELLWCKLDLHTWEASTQQIDGAIDHGQRCLWCHMKREW